MARCDTDRKEGGKFTKVRVQMSNMNKDFCRKYTGYFNTCLSATQICNTNTRMRSVESEHIVVFFCFRMCSPSDVAEYDFQNIKQTNFYNKNNHCYSYVTFFFF